MHPAKSVIFFTTASGAGYGLLIWLALFGMTGHLPLEAGFGAAAFALALGLIIAGLLSSTFHLGHPERAWRAMSQWRSSWLSREGLLAVITFVPAVIAAAVWVMGLGAPGLFLAVAVALIVLCLATVYCTAMIYASLRTIHAWNNAWAVAGYLVYALMTGALLLSGLAHAWGYGFQSQAAGLAVVLLIVGLIVKRGHWKVVQEGRSESTIGTATGLGAAETVSLLEGPHTEENYLMKEMGFRIARKHAEKLRTMVYILAFLVPAALSGGALVVAGGTAATVLAFTAAGACAIGIVLERWLFFAEAKHVVTLYYGAAYA